MIEKVLVQPPLYHPYFLKPPEKDLFKKSKVANLLSGRFQEICSDQKIGNAKHLRRSILV